MNSKEFTEPEDSDCEQDIEHPLISEKATKNGVKSINGDAEPLLKSLRKPSDLQIKLEKQLEKSRKSNGHSKMVSRRSLIVPGKGGFTDMRSVEPPLVEVSPASNGFFQDVALEGPEEEVVVFKQPSSPYEGPRDCTQQLLKDGYRLDELSDDEDLDLILPHRGDTSWCSCQNYCVLQ